MQRILADDLRCRGRGRRAIVDESGPITCAEWLDRVREADSRGDFSAAIDAAESALDLFPQEPELHYRGALAAARAGATGEARRKFHGFQELARKAIADGMVEPGLAEDIEALGARILKDEAYLKPGTVDGARLKLAATEYERVSRKYGSMFACVNAASLRLLADEPERAGDLARDALALAETMRDANPAVPDGYWYNASLAEAAFVAGDTGAAKAALASAAACADATPAARASTIRQFTKLLEARGLPLRDWLADLRNRSVIHFCGHMIGDAQSRFPAEREEEVREKIEAKLAGLDVGYGIGSLACGADILFAEALLARGADLTVVLPFESDEFVETSVRRGGDGWVDRYKACLEAANGRVLNAGGSGYLGDSALFGYGSRLAMGLAVITAERLQTDVFQLAVWDGQELGAVGGTEESVAYWQEFGRPSEWIALPTRADARHGGSGDKPAGASRMSRAVLFGDIKGFSKLQDSQMEAFVDKIMRPIADALGDEAFADKLIFSNTWGDGLFLVFDNAIDAAKFGLELQAKLTENDTEGLPDGLALRLGAHVGPTFEIEDPVLKEFNYYGAHITLAARLEPIARPGAIFASEAFAAAIAVETDGSMRCEYIGSLPAAKGYGDFPVYVVCD